MGTTTAEQLLNAKSLFSEGTPTLFKYGNYIVQNTKLVIEKLASIFIDTVLWVRGIKTGKVETKELCLDGLCVTKEQLQQLLNNADIDTPESENVPDIPEETLPDLPPVETASSAQSGV